MTQGEVPSEGLRGVGEEDWCWGWSERRRKPVSRRIPRNVPRVFLLGDWGCWPSGLVAQIVVVVEVVGDDAVCWVLTVKALTETR